MSKDKDCKLTDSQLTLIRDALSWARTLIDDPGSAMSKAETIDRIDLALRQVSDD
jgi:hypothetical protein